MQIVEDESVYTYEIKKSKFIAYLFPYRDFRLVMTKLRDEHPKARHFVYAYRYLNEFNQVVENSSDDGEPKGTSGRPSLSVLAGQKIINSGVIIVRYFGGIRLGTGGLVRAYSDAVNGVIANSILKEYEEVYKFFISFSYPSVSFVEYCCEKLSIAIEKKEFTQKVNFLLVGSYNSFKELKVLLKNENIHIEEKSCDC